MSQQPNCVTTARGGGVASEWNTVTDNIVFIGLTMNQSIDVLSSINNGKRLSIIRIPGCIFKLKCSFSVSNVCFILNMSLK